MLIKIILITCAFMMLDVITGGLVTFLFHREDFKSSIMRQGLYHKAGNIMVIGLGFLVDLSSKYYDLGLPQCFTKIICGYIIIMEIWSNYENIKKINPNIKIPELERSENK